MTAKDKEGNDRSGIVGKLLYFEAGCLCSTPDPGITNNVILNKSLYISSYNFLFYKTECLPLKGTLLISSEVHLHLSC